jgi:hypothetical protein
VTVRGRERNTGPWVLVSEGAGGESRAAVAAVRSLAAAGYRTTVTESGPNRSLAGASRACERRVPVPLVAGDGAAYASAVRAELATRDYLTSFITTDAALLALEAPVRDLLDKSKSAELAAAAGIESPPTQVFESAGELLGAAPQLTYPLVVKPALKLSSALILDSASDLEAELPADIGRALVQPVVQEPFHGLSGLAFDGKLVATMHIRYLRLWPQPCGTVAAAVTTPPDPDLEARVTTLLRDYNGPFHLDFVGRYLLDVNPRIHATLPLAMRGGANLPAMYCALLEGRPVSKVQVAAGLMFRWMEGDLRSLIWNARRGRMTRAETLAALLPHRGTVHSFATLADPGPAVVRTGYMLRRVGAGAKRASSTSASETTSASGNDTSR